MRARAEEIIDDIILQHRDDTKSAEQDLSNCISCLIIVSSDNKSSTPSETIVYLAGAIESVENCTKSFGDNSAVCVRAIWIYNKKLRSEIENSWQLKLKLSPLNSIPHDALGNGNSIMPTFPGDSAISFVNKNIEIVHKYQVSTQDPARETDNTSQEPDHYIRIVAQINRKERVVAFNETKCLEVSN